MPHRKQKKPVGKEKPASSSSPSKLPQILGGILCVVAAGAAASIPSQNNVKKHTVPELRNMLMRATLASNNGAFHDAKQVTEKVYPLMDDESLGAWDGAAGLSQTVEANLQPYAVPNNASVSLYRIPNSITPEEAETLQRLYFTAYDHYFIETPICFDYQWSIEPEFIKPNWTYKEKIVAAGVLKDSDFLRQDTGHMTSWCVSQKSATRHNVMKLKAFLNVSRSVIAHRGVSNIVDVVEEKIANLTGLPLRKAYYAQLLQYEESETYGTHTDCTINKLGVSYDDRVYTTLLYLSEVEGGETAFPLLGLDFKPKVGDLIVWKNMDARGHCDPNTAHVANAVRSGVKYVFQKWWNIKAQDHTSPSYTEAQNGFSCDRNNACREYLHIHRLRQKMKVEVP